jgi:RNA polymerase sigma-70 factor (ECF subfamily)
MVQGESTTIDPPAADAASPVSAVARRDLQRTVAAALQQLSDAERLAVVLKHIQGFTYEEISAMTAVPVGTAKSHAHRGRRKLAELLRRTGEEDAS